MPTHAVIDRASLEMAREIARRLCARPELVSVEYENIARWSARNADAPGLLDYYAEWKAILDSGLGRVLEVLESETHEGQRFRQSSPFPGILTVREVWAIKRKCIDDARRA